ncbi:MAG: hypothetical protein U9N42_11560 [Campylobacterota bacterium]|nr:hypothetical protein [Campylobacterota bacterium]
MNYYKKKFATGGVIKATAYAMEHDIEMFLASGFNLNDVESFLVYNKQDGGTLFKKDYM